MSAPLFANCTAAEEIEAAAWADFFAALPPGLACGAGASATWGPAGFSVVAPAILMTLFNRVFAVGVRQPAASRDVAAALGAYPAGVPFLVQLPPTGHTDDVQHVLAALGLRAAPRVAWIKLACDLVTPAPAASGAALASAAQLDEAADVIVAAHRLPPEMAGWFGATMRRPGWHTVVSMQDGRIVSAGLVFVHGADAWLGMGGTLPAARGRGAQGDGIRCRLQVARAAGCTRAFAEAPGPKVGEDARARSSLRNLVRAGFSAFYARPNLTL